MLKSRQTDPPVPNAHDTPNYILKKCRTKHLTLLKLKYRTESEKLKNDRTESATRLPVAAIVADGYLRLLLPL
jgi:hypothetical protein